MLTSVVNNDLSNPLVYDFSGFPRHYYKDGQFTSHGTEDLLSSVTEVLKAGGVGVEQTPRGLDHGIWGESTLCSTEINANLYCSSIQSRFQRQNQYPHHTSITTR